MMMGVFIYVSKGILGIIFFLHPVHNVSFIVGVCLSILEYIGKGKSSTGLDFKCHQNLASKLQSHGY
jgi:hypothetical protein